MSIKVMSWVWESGPAASGDCFVLIALADFADDNGRAWPSVGTIARKVRMTERGVQNILRRLEAEGWVSCETNAGPKGCNLYSIALTPRTTFTPERRSPPNDVPGGVNVVPKTPERRSPEPSLNHQEPSEEEAYASLSSGDDAPADAPTELKPFDEIAHAVTAYNATAEASGWPTVRILSKARRSALAARLREAGGLAGWEAALSKAQASPHCCGENARGWTANFDFLTRQSSFAKLMEGNYDPRNHASRADETRRGSGMVAAFAAVAARRQAADGGR